MYAQELKAILSASRFRERKIYPASLSDFASNDYLGLANHQKLLKKAFLRLKRVPYHAPKASMLVNGYTRLHASFEETLANVNGFEAGLLVGSGFLANLALIESLLRTRDHIFLDAEYHASGQLAARLLDKNQVTFFRHNDPDHLKELLETIPCAGRKIIAIEGVYSMSGAIAKKEFTLLAREHGALLIVDEAHSSGVIGERLLGYFDHHQLTPSTYEIKMGTLSKAYASYGAYILASREIITFLENRAKSIIYTTALSLFDTALAHENFLYIQKHHARLREKLEKRQKIASNALDLKLESPILAYPIANTSQLLEIGAKLQKEGFLVGVIRPPTVKTPIIRAILRLAATKRETKTLCDRILQYAKRET